MSLSEISNMLNQVRKELLDTFDHKAKDFRNNSEYNQLQNFINGEYDTRFQTKLDECGINRDDLPENIQSTIRITQGTFVQTYLAKMGKKD